MREAFPIVPGGMAPLVFTLVVGLILIAVLWLITSLAWGSRFARFEVSDEALRIRGDLYGRSVPLESLRIDSARIVYLPAEPSLQPRRKTNGSNMPGYWSGWFRLADGQRALLFLTDRSRVLYVPTRENYVMLLSPSEPERMLDALRSAGSG